MTKAHSKGMPRLSQISRRPFHFAFRQGSGLMQQTADQGRLAVIDVADDDDLQGGFMRDRIHYM